MVRGKGERSVVCCDHERSWGQYCLADGPEESPMIAESDFYISRVVTGPGTCPLVSRDICFTNKLCNDL